MSSYQLLMGVAAFNLFRITQLQKSLAGKVQAASGKEKGKELKLGGLNTYVSIPSKAPTAAVLLFTDIYGYKTEGIRSWADKLAAEETAAVQADIRKAFPSVKKFGVQGFCWGGLYSVLLSAGSPPPVSAAVVYHGSLITKSDPKLDRQINETFYKEIQGILKQKASKGIDASITSFPGQPHGFSLRGDSSEAATAKAATAAFENGVEFKKKHLAV
eukprot:gene4690-4942_t